MTLRQLRKLAKSRYLMIDIGDRDGVRHRIEFDLDDRADRRKLARYEEAEVLGIEATLARRDRYENTLLAHLA